MGVQLTYNAPSVSLGGTGGGLGGTGGGSGRMSLIAADKLSFDTQILTKSEMDCTLASEDLSRTMRDLEIDMKAEAMATRNARAENIGLSISLFVTTIIIRGMAQAVSILTKALGFSKEASEEMQKSTQALGAVMQLALGPMQMYLIYKNLELMHGSVKQVTTGVIGLSMALGAVMMYYSAFTATAPEARALMAGLATAMAIAAIASFALASGIATVKSLLGDPTAFAMIGIGAGLAIATAASIAYMTAPKAQTEYGYSRRIEREGPIYAHKGETIGRVSQPEKETSRGGNVYYITSNDPYQTAKMIERYDRRGLGRKRTSRTVV